MAVEDISESRYMNYAEAAANGTAASLPTVLPPSASEIHEWHDRAANAHVGSFRFDPRDRAAMMAGLRAGNRRSPRIDRDPSFAPALPRDPDRGQLMNAGFEFYQEERFDLAIDWESGTAYFWN